jgi:nucleoside phosphorylase
MKEISHIIGANKYREEQERSLSCDVLLVTATEVEMWAVRDMFLQKTGTFERQVISDKTYFDLGVIGSTRIFLVQSEIGTIGPGGAALVVHEAIKALSPSAIVMVGIAFGLLPSEEQNIGDILVSRQLSGYEMQKVDVGPDGQEVIKPRGDRAQASTRLLDRFRASIFDWTGPGVHFGLILSGDKLIDNKDFRDKLLRIEPEAIGG